MTHSEEQPTEDVQNIQHLIDQMDEIEVDEAGAAQDSEQVELPPDDQVAQLEALVQERTEDLQRVHAEYVNYKKRVDRDRDLARQAGIESVLRDLLPVFDSVAAADKQGELTGGFKLTADELFRVTSRYGFERFGAVGEPFDPQFHEALMQQPVPGSGEMHILEVLQGGYRVGEQIIRAARVIVGVPDGSEPDDAPDGESSPTDLA